MKHDHSNKSNAAVLACIAILCATSPAIAAGENQVELTPMERLGKHIFFDRNLSHPRTQSCASCHDPAMGFTSPVVVSNLFGGSERGAVRRRFGNRRPPTAGYATFAENFSAASANGGMFWDGRATGELVDDNIFPVVWSAAKIAQMTVHLGPATDQALAPFFGDVEQNLPNTKVLCRRIKRSHYADLWQEAWGERIRCRDDVATQLVHKRVAFAIAVWEASPDVNSYSSWRDEAIADEIDKYGSATFPLDLFTDRQNEGHRLFYSRQNSCARFCHSSSFSADGTDPDELYVSERPGYFNIGVPANPFNGWYRMDRVRGDDGAILNPLGHDWVDLGIAFRDEDGIPGSDFPGREGQFKVPTLRNVDKRRSKHYAKAFAHNAYFKSLKGIVHFYNTRDMKPVCTDSNGVAERFVTEGAALYRGCWPEAEVNSTNIFGCDGGDHCKVVLAPGETMETYCDNPANPRNIGNLCLTPDEEDAIVEYLKTLSDRHTAKPPR